MGTMQVMILAFCLVILNFQRHITTMWEEG